MQDKEPKTKETTPVRPDAEPKAARPATAAALKTRLDGLVLEREALAAEHVDLHEDLVEAHGTKGEDTAAMKVAAHDAKLRALDTIVQRATAEYQAAENAERAAEIERLKTEIERLTEARKLATDALVAAQQAEVAAIYEAEQAGVNFAGLLSAATSALDPRIHTLADIDAAYTLATDAHKALVSKADLRDEAHDALRKAETAYLDCYHRLFSNERRAIDLSTPTPA